MVEHNIFPQLAYNWVIVAYFFLAGLSVGIYAFSVGANYWKTEFKPMAKLAGMLAPILMGLGAFMLLIDLGQPLRFWRLFLSFRPTSAMFWGVWFLTIFMLFSTAYAWFLKKGEIDKAKKFAIAGLPFAFLVATYGGILLGQKAGKILWHTSLLPWMFLNGGIISGLSLVILIYARKVENNIISKLGNLIVLLLVLEIGFIVTETIMLFTGDTASYRTIMVLLFGSGYSVVFWLLQIGLGSVVPIVILLKLKTNKNALTVASALVIVGVFAMRYIIIIGGQMIR